MEEKAKFVESVCMALRAYGDGRYTHLADEPIVYAKVGGLEYLRCGDVKVNVTGGSLLVLLDAIALLLE